MIQRFRHLLAALFATVAVVTTMGVTAAPAHADPTGSSCMDPTIDGSFTKDTVTNSLGLTVWVVKFNAVGYTDANCPTALTEYRYRAAFTYNGHTTSAYHSDLDPVYTYTPLGLTRTGTRIEFPEQTLPFAGFKSVDLAVTSGSKSRFSSVWCRSNEDTWDYHFTWLPSTTVTFDTAYVDGVPRGKVSACP